MDADTRGEWRGVRPSNMNLKVVNQVSECACLFIYYPEVCENISAIMAYHKPSLLLNKDNDQCLGTKIPRDTHNGFQY